MDQFSFSKPDKYFFKLPNDWFDLRYKDFADVNPKSQDALYSILQFLISKDWLIDYFNDRSGFSVFEINHGVRNKRLRNFQDDELESNNLCLEVGTNLDNRTIKAALVTLIEKGFVESVSIDNKNFYRVNLGKIDYENGFFIVPNSWIIISRYTKSLATKLVTLYLLRHTWGYQNPDGVWLDIKGFLSGRTGMKKNEDVWENHVYDAGLGFDYATVYRSLKEAVALGWVTWTNRHYDESTRTLYNLHLDHFLVTYRGEYLGRLPWESADEYNELRFLWGLDDPNFSLEKEFWGGLPGGKTPHPVLPDQSELKPACEDADLTCKDADLTCKDADSICKDAGSTCKDVHSPTCKDVDLTCKDADLTCKDADLTCKDAGCECEDAEKIQLKDTSNTHTNTHTKYSQKIVVLTTSGKDKLHFLDQSVANAIIENNQEQFLASIGIYRPKLQEILDKNYSDEVVLAWVLFKYLEPKFREKDLLGYIINRLAEGAPAKREYLCLSSCTVREWIELQQLSSNPRARLLASNAGSSSLKNIFIKYFLGSESPETPEFLARFNKKLEEEDFYHE